MFGTYASRTQISVMLKNSVIFITVRWQPSSSAMHCGSSRVWPVKSTKKLCMSFCEFFVGESTKTWNCLGGTVETTLCYPGLKRIIRKTKQVMKFWF